MTATASRVAGYVPSNPDGYTRAPLDKLYQPPAAPADWADLKTEARLEVASRFALMPAHLERFEALQFPHHTAVEGIVVWEGVAKAMADLLAGAAKLDPALAREAYEHLAAHYREFERVPPPLPTSWKAAGDRAGQRYAPCQFKVEAIDKRERKFEGLAATWDLDLGADVIHQGAFRDTLADWRKSGRSLPLLDSHNYFSVLSAVGKLEAARETKAGLHTEWQVIGGPDGDRIMDRLEAGIIDSMSIGYQPKQFEFAEGDDDGPFSIVRHLKKVELREVSLVLFPMQPNALIDLATVKAAAAARTLGAGERSTLQSIHDELGRLLAAEPEPVGSPASKEETPVIDPFSRLARLRVQRLRASRS